MKFKSLSELAELPGEKKYKQVGVIKFGGGLNHWKAIADWRARGYSVSVQADHALIYQRC